MLRNKKGFTLVELLAVIVILAIILAIAVPTISTLIANQKKSAFAAGVKMMIKGADYIVLTDGTLGAGLTAANFGGSTTDYPTVTYSVDANKIVTMTVTGGGQFAGCITGSKTTGGTPVTVADAVTFATVTVEC